MNDNGQELLEKLIKEYGKQIYGICVSYMKNRADADDAYQETLVKVYVHIDRLPKENPAGWIFRIAINNCKDMLKKRRNNVELTEESAVVFPSEEGEVYDAIMELPIKLKEIVILRAYLGYSEKEAAGILGIRRGTAASRYARAKYELSRKLEGLI